MFCLICVYAFDFIKEPIKFPLTLERILTTQNHRFSLRYGLYLSLSPFSMDHGMHGNGQGKSNTRQQFTRTELKTVTQNYVINN